MEDLIFGTLATDELKLVYHRASRRGVQHANRIRPRDPHPGVPVTVSVELGPEVEADRVTCYYTVDGSPPSGSRGEARVGAAVDLERVHIEWDTFTWGYHSRWQGQIPGQPSGTKVRYRISAWSSAGQEVYADWPDVKRTVDRAAEAFFHEKPLPDAPIEKEPGPGHTFGYAVDRLSPPRWAREGVIYHVFVDRFYPGDGKKWKQRADLRKPFGGTLWGVAEKMDHIAQLGATVLWLSPIFPSPTVHGYNATDYYRVKETLGGDEALRAVIAAAHQRGIRVVLDMVCNHVSDQHPFFREAVDNPESPKRNWFYFDQDEEIGYRTFFGVSAMPQVNLAHPEARAWMLDVARFWLEEFEVDGYRLDHANGPGADFWSDFYTICKETAQDCFCFGEVVEPPDVQRHYIGRLDGVLDFHLCDALRKTYGRQTWGRARLERMLNQHRDYFPQNFLMPTFLDNHDMDRFQFIAGGNEEALRLAARSQFQLSGPPVIYYGTEVGLEQKVSKSSSVGLEASRGAMLWGEEQNRELFSYYQGLIQARMDDQPWKP